MLNLARARYYRPHWPWSSFKGSEACLKWNLEDLATLDIAIGHAAGRSVAVQAGGNLGLFAKRLAEDFETVITFEPDPVLYGHLRSNAPEKNITAIAAALGDSCDSVGLACCRRDNSGRAVHEGLTHITGSGDIPQVRLDDMNLQALDLLYLDIEGYEFNALRGAEQTVRKFKPVIGVEINGNVSNYSYTKEELRGWIESLGYVKVLRHRGDDIYVCV